MSDEYENIRLPPVFNDVRDQDLYGDPLETRIKEPAKVQLVSEVHSKKGGWSGNNQLGQMQPFAPDANNQQTILKLDEWGFPEVWTVSLGIRIGNQDGDIVIVDEGYNVQAVINYGVGGSTQTIIADWINGTQLSLPMNSVNVIARFSDLDPAETIDAQLSVQLSRGARADNSLAPVVTLYQFQNFPAGADVFTPLPPFARNIRFLPLSLPPPNSVFFSGTTLLGLHSGNSGITRPTISITGLEYQSTFFNGLPVSGSAKFVRVQNTGAVAFLLTTIAELAA